MFSFAYFMARNGSVIVDYRVEFTGKNIQTSTIQPVVKEEVITAINGTSFGLYEINLKDVSFDGL